MKESENHTALRRWKLCESSLNILYPTAHQCYAQYEASFLRAQRSKEKKTTGKSQTQQNK